MSAELAEPRRFAVKAARPARHGGIVYYPQRFDLFEDAVAMAEEEHLTATWCEILEANPPGLGRRFRSLCRLGRDDRWASSPYTLPKEVEQ